MSDSERWDRLHHEPIDKTLWKARDGHSSAIGFSPNLVNALFPVRKLGTLSQLIFDQQPCCFSSFKRLVKAHLLRSAYIP